jgi:hypothetical protein
VDVADRHVAHQENEPDPGHQRAVHIVCNRVGTGSTVEKCAQSIPEVEQTDNVEERGTDDECILFPGLAVGNALQ